MPSALMLAALAVLTPEATSSPQADSSGRDLAEAAQNPVTSMISLPLQNETSYLIGENQRAANVLNVQPVIPVSVSPRWSIVTRIIVPIVSQPDLSSTRAITTGLGDILTSVFFAQQASASFTWAVGPATLLPTATSRDLGGFDSGAFGIGPTAVVVATPWKVVTGALVNNVWSVAGRRGHDTVNRMTLQPFFNLNFGKGWYVVTSPVITADWTVDSEGDRWLVPVGGGLGRIFALPRGLGLNASLQGYYNALRPDPGPLWTLRASVAFLFPTP